MIGAGENRRRQIDILLGAEREKSRGISICEKSTTDALCSI